MKKHYPLMMIGFLITAFSNISCNAQDVHPYKMKFADYEQWPAIVPGDITLKNFRPYRATYTRNYISSSGAPTTDVVIMTAQRVYWYGKSIILFEYHDGANPELEETNARTQFYYLDEKTLQLYLAVGPKSGTAEDYTIVRVLSDKVATSRVNTETGETEFSELQTTDPIFPFRQLRFLIWASLDLAVGDKIKVDKIFFPSQSVTSITLGIVHEQIEYDVPDVKKYQAFVVDNANNPGSPTLNKFFIVNEPPYILGQGIYDADKDEITRWWLKMDTFEYLDD